MHFWLMLLIGVCLLLTSAFCEDNDPSVEELTDSRSTLIWTPSDINSLIIKAEAGYQIKVEVTQLDVDGESDDYVTVKSISEDGDESDALMFTYTVSGEPSYLYNNNKIQVDYAGTNESNKFSIQVSRIGEATTTTPERDSTTTTEAMPTAPVGEPATLTVYLYGRAADEFTTSEIKSLKETIAAMGAEYCKVQNCPLNDSITLNHVKIDHLEQCPILWEHNDRCVNLKFALPIIKLEHYENGELWDGYQLSKYHLNIMWETYAEKFMKNIGLELYNEPNVDKIYTNWLIVICLVTVALIILILVLRPIMVKIHKRRRKLSDTISIMGQQSNRNSQLSLTPHFLQELPPLFSNDFPMYPEQRNHKHYSDINNDFTVTDDIDPSMPPRSPNKINMSSNDLDYLEDADA